MPDWARIYRLKGALNNAVTAPVTSEGVALTSSLQMLHRVAGSDDPEQQDALLHQIWKNHQDLLDQPEALLRTAQQALHDHGWPSDVPLDAANIFWRPNKDAEPHQAASDGQVSILFYTPMVEERIDSGMISYSGVVFDFLSVDEVAPLHKVHHARLPKLAQAVQDAWFRENLSVKHPKYGRVTPSRLTELKGRKIAGHKIELLLHMCDASIAGFDLQMLEQLIPVDKSIVTQNKRLIPLVAATLLPDWQLDNPDQTIMQDDLQLSSVMFELTNGTLCEISYDYRLPKSVDPDTVFCVRIAIPAGEPQFSLES